MFPKSDRVRVRSRPPLCVTRPWLRLQVSAKRSGAGLSPAAATEDRPYRDAASLIWNLFRTVASRRLSQKKQRSRWNVARSSQICDMCNEDRHKSLELIVRESELRVDHSRKRTGTSRLIA